MLRLHLRSLGTAALLVAACGSACLRGGQVQYPEGTQGFRCSDDCDKEAAERCPGGYQVLHRESWVSSQTLGGRSRSGSSAPGKGVDVHHTAMRILCSS